jgi:hypothetical protein
VSPIFLLTEFGEFEKFSTNHELLLKVSKVVHTDAVVLAIAAAIAVQFDSKDLVFSILGRAHSPTSINVISLSRGFIEVREAPSVSSAPVDRI